MSVQSGDLMHEEEKQNSSVQILGMMHGTENLCREVIFYIYEYYWLRVNILQRIKSFLTT